MTRDSRSMLVMERLEEGYCKACARGSCTVCTRGDCTCGHYKRRLFPTDVLHEWVQARGYSVAATLTAVQRRSYYRETIGMEVADEIAYAFGAHQSEIWDDWWQL